ncbi:MAG: SPFH domain-containing protein [Candidatus Acidiferrales bacterium]
MVHEKQARAVSGWLMLFLLLALLVGSIWALVVAARGEQAIAATFWSVVMAVDIFLLCGFIVVNPNEAQVVLLFGNYLGSIKQSGFWWMNPLCTKKRVSLRVRNFETGKLKVNDQHGNPIEIAAVVVWQVVETAEAIFHVDDYEHFVHVQSEAALRNLATSYPYDQHEEGEKALRSHTGEIADQIKREIQDRLSKAGVDVIESRMSHLAYVPEIASAMLRRQQATAIIAARQKIVEGAVSMVEMALDQLAAKHVVELDEERKASMVSNLLVVLCSDRDAQPVVNAGTLYQ